MATVVEIIKDALGLGSPQTPSSSPLSLGVGKYSGITPSQKANAIGRTVTPIANNSSYQDVALNTIISCFDPITKRISSSRKIIESIKVLAPEIDQASNIMGPSVMSPNDLQTDRISYIADGEVSKTLPENERDRILEFVGKTFTADPVNMTKLLPKALHEALYGVGAQPYVILPENELVGMINYDDGQNNPGKGVSFTAPAQESYAPQTGPLTALGRKSIEIAKAVMDQGSPKDKGDKSPSAYSFGTESIQGMVDGLYSELPVSPSNDKLVSARKRTQEWAIGLEAIERDIVAMSGGQLFDDNPQSLRQVSVAKKTLDEISKEITKTLNTPKTFKERQFIDMSNNVDSIPLPESVAPLFLIPPAEAFAPVFAPGAPEDHLGYFAMIDTNTGNFVTQQEIMATDLEQAVASNYDRNNLYSNLFKSMGIDEIVKTGETNKITNRVYNMVVDEHIKRVLSGVGLDKLSIGNINNLYSCMFTRYLKNTGTRLIFLPKDMVVYHAYEYYEDGTGKSRLDSVQWALTMRTTLLVCAIMASVKNASDHKTVTVTLNDRELNPMAKLETVRSMFVKKQGFDFSINDPDVIRESILTDSLSIKPVNFPGFTNFEVARDSQPQNNNVPDTAIIDNVVNMAIRGLLVPASALNQTSENEYMRSVASTNLYFYNTVCHIQDMTETHGNKLIRTYLKHYRTFREMVKKVISDVLSTSSATKNKSDTEDAPPVVDTENEVTKEQLETMVDRFIDEIELKLPRPNIAPAVAQNDEFNKVVEIANNLGNALFPDMIKDFSEDQRINKGVAYAKFMAVREVLKKYIDSSGMSFLLPLSDMIGRTDSLESILNIGQEVKTTIDNWVKDPSNPTPSDDSGDIFSSGGDGFQM